MWEGAGRGLRENKQYQDLIYKSQMAREMQDRKFETDMQVIDSGANNLHSCDSTVKSTFVKVQYQATQTHLHIDFDVGL